MRTNTAEDVPLSVGRVAGAVATMVLLAILVACWPQPLGGSVAYARVSGVSMEPRYHSGDLVIVRAHASYHDGDVIAYRIPKGEIGEGVVVVHRVIGGGARNGYVTQGDNRTVPDPWHPRPADVLGAQWVTVPGGARVIEMLRTPFGLALAAGLLAAFASASLATPRRRRAAQAPV